MKPSIVGFAFLTFMMPHPEPSTQAVAPECWGAEDRSGSFGGTMSTSGGRIQEQIGRGLRRCSGSDKCETGQARS